jgi:hypothetical protein
MRSLLAAALLAAASAMLAAPASAGCATMAEVPRVTVPAAQTSAGGTHVDRCEDGTTPPPCPTLVTVPGATVPGVGEVTSGEVDNCYA